MKQSKDNSGVKSMWAWAGLAPFESDKKSKKEDDKQPIDKSLSQTDSEKAITDLINTNPSMNASTFYNTLKAKGFEIVAPKKVEADSASSQPAGILIGDKKGQKKESDSIKDKFVHFRFLEAVKKDSFVGPHKFRVVLLQEGMGNFGDAFYYTKDALMSSVPVFEGAQIYSDHPSREDDENRPERTVKDLLGHFENIHIEETDDGRSQLMGDLVILKDEPYRWARALMSHAVEYSQKYPDKDFIGLSINASGDAQPVKIEEFLKSSEVPQSILVKLQEAMLEGIDEIRLVSAIKDAVSCDLVTKAGAGGKILEFLEGEKMDKKKEMKADPEKGFEKDMPAQDHADAPQDMELIKKMISKHMGDEKEEMDESSEKHSMEAFEYFKKERGMEDEEAAKHAYEAMKCAQHMAKKGEAEKPEDEEKHDDEKCEDESEEKKHESEEKKESEEKCESEEKKKESDEKEKHKESSVKLVAENARLRAELGKIKLEKDVEKLLQESKLPRSATKQFKESMGEIKSVEEFKKMFKLFVEAYKAGGAASNELLDLSIEKTSRLVESEGRKTVSDFSDCIK